MINQVYVDKLVSLIRQKIITIDDVKNAEYVQPTLDALNAIGLDGYGNPLPEE